MFSLTVDLDVAYTAAMQIWTVVWTAGDGIVPLAILAYVPLVATAAIYIFVFNHTQS